jgi:hypothetical protein
MNDQKSNASSDPVVDPSTLDVLRAATATMRELPRLLKVVRTIYRAQDRKPQHEPAHVTFIERYVRFYYSKPIGMLDEAHARAYLSHVAGRPGMTREKQELAHEALLFFHNEVLHQDVAPITDYVRAPASPPAPDDGPEAGGTARSFWGIASEGGADAGS